MGDGGMTWADYGKPISGSPEILGAAELVRRLYCDLRESTGGPLHCMLDDGNIYDDQMPDAESESKLFEYLWNGDFAKWSQAGDDISPEWRQAIQDCCRGILYAFNQMNEAERTCVLAWHWGDIKRELPDWYAAHQTPQRQAEAVEMADRFVRLAVAVPLGVRPEPERKACTPIPCPPLTEVNAGGSVNIALPPPSSPFVIYENLFAAPGLVSMAPVMIDASGFTSGLVAFDPDYRADLAPGPD